MRTSETKSTHLNNYVGMTLISYLRHDWHLLL